MHQVLVAEPDSDIASGISSALAQRSIFTVHRRHGAAAANEARLNCHSVILLERILPGRDGISICQELRSEGIDTPILIMSRRSGPQEIVASLSAGADGLVGKPFSLVELTARIEALIRRTPVTKPSLHEIGELTIDRSDRKVRFQDREILLRRREYNILSLLADNCERALSRSQINVRTGSHLSDSEDSCIDVHISNIRKSLARAGCENMIETVFGHGYRLRPARKD